MAACVHCHADLPQSAGRMGLDGEKLCSECHRAELLALLQDADLDREEMTKLRRRIEDVLRKNPTKLLRVAAWLASEEVVRIDDLT